MKLAYNINHILIGMLLSVTSVKCWSQNFEGMVRDKYVQSTPSLVNNGATLIFYADSSYLNFGILKDTESLEMYIWYSYGTWKVNDNTIACTVAKTFDAKKIVNEIKFHYRLRPDYRLVDNYYEFASENYNNHIFVIKEHTATDTVKNIEYLLKTDTSAGTN
jgi:hypothetical protein